MASANVVMQSFDKGLRSAWLPEQLSTISKLSRMFDEHPVPTFVNAILVRLAEAFKDGSNDVRISIARALSQCGTHLTLAFSSAEILRQISVVSHANDPNAREATLDVFASLAPIFPENSQAHHLICESLAAEHDGEFRAACMAMKAFAKLSSSFAESVVLQIGKILEDSTTCEDRKIKLCGVFETMSANAHTIEQVFGLLDNLMNKSTSDDFLAAILESTTSLCIVIRYAIPKQIDTLLNLLANKENSPNRSLIIMIELRRLAIYSNIWVEEQISKFISILSPTMSKATISCYFDVAVALSKTCSTANLVMLKELVASSSAYGSIPDPEVSVRYVRFASNVVCSPKAFRGSDSEYIEAIMTSLVIVIVAALSQGKLREKLAKKFYRSIGDILVAFPHDQYQFSSMMISSIFSIFDSKNVADNNQKERLELMCRLIDSNKMYIDDIHRWTITIFENRRDLVNAYPKLFSYLLLAVGVILPESIVYNPILFDNDELKYATALNAFRNGHWKRIASENLKSINSRNLSKPSADWIFALNELAQSELEELSFEGLMIQQKHLRASSSILNVASVSSVASSSTSSSSTSATTTSRFDEQFRFAADMIECMQQTSEVFTHLLSIMKPFLTVLTAALKPGKFFNPVTAKRFTAALATVEQPINESLASWSALCRTSFCADATSLDLITMFYSKMSILLAAVRVILEKQSAETLIQLPSVSCHRTGTQLQLERLQWASERISALKFENVPNLNTIQTLYVIAEQLAITPYMLPRFFFQQFYHVDFKITTTPQAADKSRGVNVEIGDTVPIRVDGVITSTHPSHIRQIIVIAEVNHVTSQVHNSIWTETVEPNEQNYFTAQFLLSFKQTCDIKFRLEFVDSTSRKLWKSTTTANLSINVREIGKSREAINSTQTLKV